MNVPGEWTLRREFLRLQTEDREGGREGGHRGGGGQQRQQVGFEFNILLLHSLPSPNRISVVQNGSPNFPFRCENLKFEWVHGS